MRRPDERDVLIPPFERLAPPECSQFQGVSDKILFDVTCPAGTVVTVMVVFQSLDVSQYPRFSYRLQEWQSLEGEVYRMCLDASHGSNLYPKALESLRFITNAQDQVQMKYLDVMTTEARSCAFVPAACTLDWCVISGQPHAKCDRLAYIQILMYIERGDTDVSRWFITKQVENPHSVPGGVVGVSAPMLEGAQFLLPPPPGIIPPQVG